MLRNVASRGIWVSADPDVILKMGVKEVLHRTKHLGWGSDTHLYRTAAAFREAFPARLQSTGPRVLKQNRGNGGQGVWRVELIASSKSDAAMVCVLETPGQRARRHGAGGFQAPRREAYFAAGGASSTNRSRRGCRTE